MLDGGDMTLRFRLGPTLIFRLRARAILLKWQLSFVSCGAESFCVCHGVGHLWPRTSLLAFLWDWQACGFIQPTLGSCKQGNTETEWYVHAEQWDRMVRPCWTMTLNGTSMLNNETEWYVHAEQWDWMVHPYWTTRLNGTSMLNNETEWYVHAEQRDWMVRPCWTMRLNGTSILLEFTRYVSFHRSMSPPNNSNVSSAWVSRFICACHPATTTVMSHWVDLPADVAFVPASVRSWSLKTIEKNYSAILRSWVDLHALLEFRDVVFTKQVVGVERCEP